MSWKSELAACGAGMLVVIALAAGTSRVQSRQLDEAWVRVQETEGEIASTQAKLANTQKALKWALLPCAHDLINFREEIRETSAELEEMRLRKAPASEMVPVMERLRRDSIAFREFLDDIERRQKAVGGIEGISEDIHRLKVQLADLEAERDELTRMLVAGGRVP